VHALRSHMSDMCFHVEAPFDCLADDSSDAAFIWASKFIRGRDTEEEFVACSVWPLGAGVSFDQVSVGVSPVSKLKVPLPNFVASRKDDEDGIKFLVRVALEAKVIVGSYTCPKHDTCIAGLHNEGRLNRGLELTGVAYEPRPVLGSDAFIESSKKRKTDYVGKVLVKHPKALGKEKGGDCKDLRAAGNAQLEMTV
jgi:hypothetical protein